MTSPLQAVASQAPRCLAPKGGTKTAAALPGKGDYASLDVVGWFTAHQCYGRDLGEGKHAVRCPWEEQHSSGAGAEDSDTVVYVNPDQWPGFDCKHSHCQGRTFKDVLTFWGDADSYCGREFQPAITWRAGARDNGAAGDPSPVEFSPSINQWPAPLRSEALHGFVGQFVAAVGPFTEADPVALLTQLLVAFGNALGRYPYFVAEGDRHYLNLYMALVGLTAKGRKGSSWGRVATLCDQAAPQWTQSRIGSGLSSGEGLIWQVRDPIEKQVPVKEKGRVVDYETVIDDPGVEDKRFLVLEAELATALRVLGRDGNTLSAVVRNAWDTGNLRSLTKNSPAKATGAHISIIGHITRDELLRYLDSTEAGNGFGNRFLWICSRRSKTLPEGGTVPTEVTQGLAETLADRLRFAAEVGEMRRNSEARTVWHAVYPALSEGKPGLLGAMIARAEAQVMRLACLYALLDASSTIRKEHLMAALALWDYSEASARFIFGETMGDPIADEILTALERCPAGLTRSDISNHFGRHISAAQIGRALRMLTEGGRIRGVKEETAGRPVERWFRATS